MSHRFKNNQIYCKEKALNTYHFLELENPECLQTNHNVIAQLKLCVKNFNSEILRKKSEVVKIGCLQLLSSTLLSGRSWLQP